MKFHQLLLHQQFRVAEYPECTFERVRDYKGSCCTPAHNAKMRCTEEGVVKEEPVLLEKDQEVILIQAEDSDESPQEKKPVTGHTVLDPPIKIGGGKFGESVRDEP